MSIGSDDGWGVVALVGLYGDSGRHRLEALTPFLAEGDPVDTIINLTDLALLDPTVISWMLRVKALLDSQGRQLRLAGLSSQHLTILQLRGLGDMFAVYPDVDSARSS